MIKLSQALDYTVIGIALISMGLFQIGKMLEKEKIILHESFDGKTYPFVSSDHPKKFLGMEYYFTMMILSLVTTIFCIWAVVIIVPPLIETFFG